MTSSSHLFNGKTHHKGLAIKLKHNTINKKQIHHQLSKTQVLTHRSYFNFLKLHLKVQKKVTSIVTAHSNSKIDSNNLNSSINIKIITCELKKAYKNLDIGNLRDKTIPQVQI